MVQKQQTPDWKEHGLNSENFVLFNLTEKIQIIGGTWYGGEMKKGMFAMMNYYLPLKGMASMHCSANVGRRRCSCFLWTFRNRKNNIIC